MNSLGASSDDFEFDASAFEVAGVVEEAFGAAMGNKFKRWGRFGGVDVGEDENNKRSAAACVCTLLCSVWREFTYSLSACRRGSDAKPDAFVPFNAC